MLPDAPPEDPIDLLVACHRKLEARLDALGAVAERLAAEPRAAKAAEALAAGLKQFDGPGRWHLEDEERSILPRLLAVDPEAAEALAALEPDHAAIEAGWAALRPVLAALRDALAAGEAADPAQVARMAALVPPFAALHRRHHADEEARVLPRARAALGEAERAAIAAEMRARRGG